MKRLRNIYIGLVLAVSISLVSVAAYAQWVMIGRKSMGVIQNLRSEHSDVATVLLEAPADKVYAAAIRTLSTKNKVKIMNKDDATRTIDFSSKGLDVKMKVSSVDDKVSMLTLASPGTILRPGNVSGVVEAVLRVCKEMNVECHQPEK